MKVKKAGELTERGYWGFDLKRCRNGLPEVRERDSIGPWAGSVAYAFLLPASRNRHGHRYCLER